MKRLSPLRISILQHVSESERPILATDILQHYSADELKKARHGISNSVRDGYLVKHQTAVGFVYSLTEKGKAALAVYGIESSVIIPPTIVTEADQVADAVGTMLRRNTEYRNALINIRDMIDQLLKTT